jgi:hypothetical protein
VEWVEIVINNLLAIDGGISISFENVPFTLTFHRLTPGMPWEPSFPGFPVRPRGPVKPMIEDPERPRARGEEKNQWKRFNAHSQTSCGASSRLLFGACGRKIDGF